MRRPPALLAAAATAGLLLVLAACGDSDGDSADDGDRTVEIAMVDIAFEPETLEVDEGETVRFVFTNTGDVAHDAFIGDEAAQEDHEAEMRAEDGDEGHDGGHGDDEGETAVTVEPGDTGELTYTFDTPGTMEIGCHQEGHYDAGMKIIVDVA